MEKTLIEIYGPVYDIICKLKTASPEENDSLMKELYRVGELVYDELTSFTDEFCRIRDSVKELEARIQQLNALLDKRMKNLSYLDLADSMTACEAIYRDFWDKLDLNSQKYLAMANYLFKLFSGDEADYSPSVVEYGRAVENELKSKIFTGYVISLISSRDSLKNDDNHYSDLIRAVSAFSRDEKYYIPARIMVRYLTYLSDHKYDDNAYNDALKHFLEKEGIDERIVSDSDFTEKMDEIFDKYRNSAAHAGNTMESTDVNTCREKTKKVLKKFMRAL